MEDLKEKLKLVALEMAKNESYRNSVFVEYDEWEKSKESVTGGNKYGGA